MMIRRYILSLFDLINIDSIREDMNQEDFTFALQKIDEAPLNSQPFDDQDLRVAVLGNILLGKAQDKEI